MDLELTEAQRGARDIARRFSREKLGPIGVEADRSHRYPAEAIDELAKLGMLVIFLPEQYGGAGLDHVSYSLVLEELAVECASTAVIMSAHCSLASWPILGLGSEKQKNHFLPKMATGNWLGCFALTEPQAGSDAAGQKTRAILDGDSYVINGTKNFITNAPQSKVAIVFAMTQLDKGHHGISAFAVETDTPGWAVTRVEDKMGIHGAHSAQLSFSDMRVPRENLLLDEGQGFKYAQERLTFGKPIAQYQAIQWKLADMAVEIDAARLLTHRAATLKDRGESCTKESAMAKLFAAETAMKSATEAVQIHGGYGYTKEFKVERYFRDAKITEIYEGTSEIQRLVIASSVLENR